MNLENNVLSERSQTQRSPITWLHVYEIYRIGKSIEAESKLIVPGSGDRGLGDWPINGYGIFFWSDENVLELDRDYDYTI